MSVCVLCLDIYIYIYTYIYVYTYHFRWSEANLGLELCFSVWVHRTHQVFGSRGHLSCGRLRPGRFFGGLPSGKLTVCYGKSLVFNGKTHENSMAMFNSYVCLTEGRVGEIGLIWAVDLSWSIMIYHDVSWSIMIYPVLSQSNLIRCISVQSMQSAVLYTAI